MRDITHFRKLFRHRIGVQRFQVVLLLPLRQRLFSCWRFFANFCKKPLFYRPPCGLKGAESRRDLFWGPWSFGWCLRVNRSADVAHESADGQEESQLNAEWHCAAAQLAQVFAQESHLMRKSRKTALKYAKIPKNSKSEFHNIRIFCCNFEFVFISFSCFFTLSLSHFH